jgi:hypothetical protein
MNQAEPTTINALQRLGMSVSYREHGNGSGSWGWAMKNDKLTRPWVGNYETWADATNAALDWVLEQAWRGVLVPILQAMNSTQELRVAEYATDWDVNPAYAEELLAPWLPAFERTTHTNV